MRATARTLLALAAGISLIHPASAGDGHCRQIDHEGRGYAVCEASAGEDLRLFLLDDAGEAIGTFDRLASGLAAEGRRIVFAMNAGMYHPDRRPVGLFIAEGRTIGALVTAAGPGNFGMRPNGVFCVGPNGFAVIESRRFADGRPDCRYASQSGPMLVIDGALHPRFLPESTSRHIRNGVGVSADGQRAVFALSDRPVSFHEFARLFRDVLGCPQALYFDGSISRLRSAELGRDDLGLPMGPMVALVAPAD